MKYLVTGGAGFIGSNLCRELLEQGHEVACLDDLSTGNLRNINELESNPRFEFFNHDLTKPFFPDKIDAIFNLACPASPVHYQYNPIRTLKMGTLAMYNVLGMAAKLNIPILQASTSEVYGKAMHYNKSSQGLKEDHDSVFGNTSIRRWAYATSKALDEFMTLAYYYEKQLPAVIVRFFNTVGPGQLGDYGMVLPIFVHKALANDPIPIFGDGSQRRSFTHVDDASKAIIKLMNTDSALGQVFNVGNENEITIKELAELVIKKCNSKSKIEYIPYEKAYGNGFEDMKRRKPDLNKIRKLINYSPKIDLDSIINQVIEYQRSA